MPTLWMLVGMPGSGKTTWARSQNFKSDTHFYSTDEILESIAAGLNTTYSSVFDDYIGVAGTTANSWLNEAIAACVDVVWDQTNLTASSRKKKLARFPKEYNKIAVYFDLPTTVDEWKRRLASRPGKLIPSSALVSMSKTFELPTTAEGFSAVITVTDECLDKIM